MRRLLAGLKRAMQGKARAHGAARAGEELVDLLGRKPVNLDTPQVQRFLASKRVLVTGAGGSIGSEICRQIIRFCPQSLVLLDRAENALFEIDRELRERWVGADLRPRIADIGDAQRIDQIFRDEQPQVVFHCAAHKHVPMMEHNAGEAIKNNVFGTKTVADAAAEHGASAFVLVSTDKAVNPTSAMGASKRVAELYVQSLNIDEATERRSDEGIAEDIPLQPFVAPSLRRSVASHTRFVAVRFGNVIGSSGSVLPIFQKQIDAGGPVTVTHPDMQRYFMTIPEAAQLVMQAGAIAQGGEIFVLDMGQPVRILDLAKDLIEKRGLTVGKDIEIAFTGLRPGEKLYEELSCDNEQIAPTSHEKIHVWRLPKPGRQQVHRMLDLLAGVIHAPREQVLFALSQCVTEYTPDLPKADQPIDQATNLRLLAQRAA